MKVSVQKILKEMPDNLSGIEKLRYLYLELGNVFSYNRKYLYIKGERELKDMYEDFITVSMIEDGNYQNKINAICKQHNEILSETINKENWRSRYTTQESERIKAKTVGYEEGLEEHIEVLATIGDKNYFLDINTDLYKIQKGLKTKGFARIEKTKDGTICEVLSEEELKQIDEKLGYCKNSLYTDDIVLMLKKEMDQEENWEKYIQYDGKDKNSSKEDAIFKYKLDFIFKHLKNNMSEEEKMNILEISKYYKMLFGRLFTEKENSKIRRIDADIQENGKLDPTFIYEIKLGDNRLYYLYKDKERSAIQVQRNELLEMQQNGTIKYDDHNVTPNLEDTTESR